ncbi:MAG: serine kinase [Smithella sp.]
MDIEIIANALNLKIRSAEGNLKKNISGGYTGDLLSDVMANSHEGDIWITRQVHQNIVAVASLKDHAGIILVNSCEPAKDTLEKAIQENIPILISDLNAFELSARIYNLLAKKD